MNVFGCIESKCKGIWRGVRLSCSGNYKVSVGGKDWEEMLLEREFLFIFFYVRLERRLIFNGRAVEVDGGF